MSGGFGRQRHQRGICPMMVGPVMPCARVRLQPALILNRHPCVRCGTARFAEYRMQAGPAADPALVHHCFMKCGARTTSPHPIVSNHSSIFEKDDPVNNRSGPPKGPRGPSGPKGPRGPRKFDDRRPGGFGGGAGGGGDRPFRAREDRNFEDRPRRPRFEDRDSGFGDRPRGDRPYGDRPREDRPFGDRPREDRPYRDRPREDRPFGDRPREDRPYGDRPRGDRPYGDRPRGERPYGDRPRGDRPYGDRPRGDRPYGDRPRGDRPYGDRPREDRPYGDRPRGDRPRPDRGERQWDSMRSFSSDGDKSGRSTEKRPERPARPREAAPENQFGTAQAGADEKLIVVAEIAGAFGVKGEVRLRVFTDDPEEAFRFGPLLDGLGRVVLTPVRWRAHEGVYVAGSSDGRSREFWEGLKGLKLHVPRSALPELEEGEYYFEDLIGLAVQHMDQRPLGKVIAVHNFGASDLLEIAATPGFEGAWFLPYSDDFDVEIDLRAGRIIVDAPEAFLPFGEEDDDELDEEQLAELVAAEEGADSEEEDFDLIGGEEDEDGDDDEDDAGEDADDFAGDDDDDDDDDEDEPPSVKRAKPVAASRADPKPAKTARKPKAVAATAAGAAPAKPARQRKKAEGKKKDD